MASENQPAIIESSAMYRNNICGKRNQCVAKMALAWQRRQRSISEIVSINWLAQPVCENMAAIGENGSNGGGLASAAENRK
jgi:hypothetical protein